MQRKKGIDLCKLFAMLLVFILHYIGWSGYFETVQDNKLYSCFIMFLMQIAVTCVPLFFMITGFLSASTETGKNYKGAFSVFSVYVFYALLLIWVTMYKYRSVYSAKAVIGNLFKIDNIIYREWYVRYYILLLLFMPFLNTLWKALEKDKKKYLLILLFLTTALPQSISALWNIEIFVTRFAGMMYILFYYFVGKWIAEYGIRLNKKQLAILLCITAIFTTVLYFTMYLGKIVSSGSVIKYGRIGTVIISISIFGLLHDVDIKERNYRFIKWCSNASLDTYLGALALEHLLYDSGIQGFAFLKSNLAFLLFIIVILIVCGNFRKFIGKFALRTGGLKIFGITIIIIGLLYISVRYAKYELLPEDFTINNGKIERESVYATGEGCVTSGAAMNLTPGTWKVYIYYRVSDTGNYADAAYYDNDGNAFQYAVWELDEAASVREVPLDVEEGTNSWEIRTFYGGQGEMEIEKIMVQRIK